MRAGHISGDLLAVQIDRACRSDGLIAEMVGNRDAGIQTCLLYTSRGLYGVHARLVLLVGAVAEVHTGNVHARLNHFGQDRVGRGAERANNLCFTHRNKILSLQIAFYTCLLYTSCCTSAERSGSIKSRLTAGFHHVSDLPILWRQSWQR